MTFPHGTATSFDITATLKTTHNKSLQYHIPFALKFTNKVNTSRKMHPRIIATTDYSIKPTNRQPVTQESTLDATAWKKDGRNIKHADITIANHVISINSNMHNNQYTRDNVLTIKLPLSTNTKESHLQDQQVTVQLRHKEDLIRRKGTVITYQNLEKIQQWYRHNLNTQWHINNCSQDLRTPLRIGWHYSIW